MARVPGYVVQDVGDAMIECVDDGGYRARVERVCGPGRVLDLRCMDVIHV